METQYKLIIVDDFFVERETAKEILEQSDLPLKIISEFENGKQAFDFLQNNPVDIVLADIEMPIVNGLELLERIKAAQIKSDIIFFSLHNRFEYVQKALSLGAFGYVIKPIEPNELLDVFKRLIEKKKRLIEEHERLEGLKQTLEKAKPILADKFLRELFLPQQPEISYREEQLSFFDMDINKDDDFSVSIMELDGYQQRTNEYSFAEKELFILNVDQEISRYFKSFGILSVKIESGIWAFLISRQKLSLKSESSIYDLFERFIERMQVLEISLSCSISEYMKDLNSVRESFSLAREAMNYKFSVGYGQIIDASEIDDTPQGHIIDFNEMQTQISRIIHSGDTAEIRRYIHDLFDIRKRTYNRQRIKKIAFNLINALQSAVNELNLTIDDIFGPNTVIQDRLQPFETVGDVADEIITIMKTTCEYIGKKADNSSLVVRRVRNYIEEHYHERITVQNISDSIFYSPNYLNNLFKKETNQTLLEYLTKVRIEKAKQLLHEPNMKIYMMAEAVGYSQESYFRTVFKRLTGLNPKEYIEKISK